IQLCPIEESGPIDRSLHLHRRKWNRAQPHAGGVEDGIRDRRRYDRRRRLAGTPWPLPRPVDELDLDLRHIGESPDRIGPPMEARHGGLVEQELLEQAAAHGLDDVALDLVPEPIGIDDLPAIVADEEALDMDCTTLPIDLDLRNGPNISAHQVVSDI